MERIIKEFIIVAAFGLACSSRYGSGYFIEERNDIDGKASALSGSAGFPIQKIKAIFSACINDNYILLASGFLRPLLPLVTLLFLGA
jgi:hypothetical protein